MLTGESEKGLGLEFSGDAEALTWGNIHDTSGLNLRWPDSSLLCLLRLIMWGSNAKNYCFISILGLEVTITMNMIK